MTRHAAPDDTAPTAPPSLCRPRHAASPFTMSVAQTAWLALALLAAASVNLLAPAVIR